jgi:hypothetical protein
MLGFKTLSIVFAIAAGAIAAPLAGRAATSSQTGLSVPTILNDITTQLQPLAAQLSEIFYISLSVQGTERRE